MEIGFAMSFAFSILRDFVLRQNEQKERLLASLVQLNITISDQNRRQEFLTAAKGVKSQIRMIERSLQSVGDIFFWLLIWSAVASAVMLLISGFNPELCEPTINIILALVVSLAPSPILFVLFYNTVRRRYMKVHENIATLAANQLHIRI
jgi:hypothetical protein